MHGGNDLFGFDYVAGQVGVAPAALAGYWAGRSIKYQRARMREALGFRGVDGRRRAALDALAAGRGLPGRAERGAHATRCCGDAAAIGSSRRAARASIGCSARPGAARAGHDAEFTARTVARRSDDAIERLEKLVSEAADSAVGGGVGLLAELKADPGRVGLKTLLAEIEKLERVRAVGLPGDLFAQASERQLAAWRARAAKLYPSDLRAAAGEADDASMREPPNQVGCRNVFDYRERSAIRGGVQRWTIANGCLARGEAR